jgi:hypothetical protein
VVRELLEKQITDFREKRKMGFSVKGFVKGVVNVGKGALTGNVKQVVKGFGQQFGLVSTNGKYVGSVSDSAEKKLLTEQAESREKRRRLFATEGGALGQEVESVGLSGDVRGSIFGNRSV